MLNHVYIVILNILFDKNDEENIMNFCRYYSNGNRTEGLCGAKFMLWVNLSELLNIVQTLFKEYTKTLLYFTLIWSTMKASAETDWRLKRYGQKPSWKMHFFKLVILRTPLDIILDQICTSPIYPTILTNTVYRKSGCKT